MPAPTGLPGSSPRLVAGLHRSSARQARRHCQNAPMSDDNQIAVPPSFIALFIEPGRYTKPSAPRAVIAERYEFCEDLATALVDAAQAQLWDLKIGEEEVLRRIHQGLLAGPAAALDAAQAQWVVTRLAELLRWPPLRFVAAA